MDSIELGVLEVCQEVVLRQQEMLPLLATALRTPQDQVFYTWAFRRCKQRGRLDGTAWVYFFHGLECDLENDSDGRFLRIDFGPRGRVDTFTAWGVIQFLITSASPWREFPQLKAYFAGEIPPSNPIPGAYSRFLPVWDRLESKGAFEKADPRLIEFVAKYTYPDTDGSASIRLPPETSEETFMDCSVAGRQRLSQRSLQLLQSHSSRACPTATP